MGTAALAAVPELETITLPAPNTHDLLVDLKPFGLDNPNRVFTATGEPHGDTGLPGVPTGATTGRAARRPDPTEA